MMRRVSWCAVLSLLVACGRGEPVDRPSTGAATTAIAVPTSGGGATAASASEIPGLIDSACVRGDPVEGISWSLDSVGATAIASQLLASLSTRDSAYLAARIARMVDLLPTDTTLADFRGLPVTVQSAWRSVPADGDTIVIALAVRRLPIESAPLEERFTVIAVPGARSGDRAPLVAQWHLRDVGWEEELIAREFVGGFVEQGTLALAFVEEADSGVRLALVSREEGRWMTRWTGERPECRAPDAR